MGGVGCGSLIIGVQFLVVLVEAEVVFFILLGLVFFN